MQNIIVTKEVLEVYDQYEGDFGLLDERWASEKDRQRLTTEQMVLFSEYEDKLHLIKLDTPAMSLLRERALKRLPELEKVIDPEVVRIMRKRVLR